MRRVLIAALLLWAPLANAWDSPEHKAAGRVAFDRACANAAGPIAGFCSAANRDAFVNGIAEPDDCHSFYYSNLAHNLGLHSDADWTYACDIANGVPGMASSIEGWQALVYVLGSNPNHFGAMAETHYQRFFALALEAARRRRLWTKDFAENPDPDVRGAQVALQKQNCELAAFALGGYASHYLTDRTAGGHAFTADEVGYTWTGSFLTGSATSRMAFGLRGCVHWQTKYYKNVFVGGASGFDCADEFGAQLPGLGGAPVTFGGQFYSNSRTNGWISDDNWVTDDGPVGAPPFDQYDQTVDPTTDAVNALLATMSADDVSDTPGFTSTYVSNFAMCMAMWQICCNSYPLNDDARTGVWYSQCHLCEPVITQDAINQNCPAQFPGGQLYDSPQGSGIWVKVRRNPLIGLYTVKRWLTLAVPPGGWDGTDAAQQIYGSRADQIHPDGQWDLSNNILDKMNCRDPEPLPVEPCSESNCDAWCQRINKPLPYNTPPNQPRGRCDAGFPEADEVMCTPEDCECVTQAVYDQCGQTGGICCPGQTCRDTQAVCNLNNNRCERCGVIYAPCCPGDICNAAPYGILECDWVPEDECNGRCVRSTCAHLAQGQGWQHPYCDNGDGVCGYSGFQTRDCQSCCDHCVPDCTNKECGPDGCGGSCGDCYPGYSCNNGHCDGGCTPSCPDGYCGSDGCGGKCTCPSGVCDLSSHTCSGGSTGSDSSSGSDTSSGSGSGSDTSSGSSSSSGSGSDTSSGSGSGSDTSSGSSSSSASGSDTSSGSGSGSATSSGSGSDTSSGSGSATSSGSGSDTSSGSGSATSSGSGSDTSSGSGSATSSGSGSDTSSGSGSATSSGSGSDTSSGSGSATSSGSGSDTSSGSGSATSSGSGSDTSSGSGSATSSGSGSATSSGSGSDTSSGSGSATSSGSGSDTSSGSGSATSSGSSSATSSGSGSSTSSGSGSDTSSGSGSGSATSSGSGSATSSGSGSSTSSGSGSSTSSGSGSDTSSGSGSGSDTSSGSGSDTSSGSGSGSGGTPDGGSRDAGTCFVAGTPIAMADGTERPIEMIRVGDRVLSWNPESRRVVSAAVTETFVHRAAGGLVRIDNRVVATGNHLVRAGDQWKRADTLTAGDELLALDGARIPIVRLLELPVPEAALVYNLEVAGEHDYFAGGILVHNKVIEPQPLPNPPEPAYVRHGGNDNARASGDSADQQPAPASPPAQSYFGCAAAGSANPSSLLALAFATVWFYFRRRRR